MAVVDEALPPQLGMRAAACPKHGLPSGRIVARHLQPVRWAVRGHSMRRRSAANRVSLASLASLASRSIGSIGSRSSSSRRSRNSSSSNRRRHRSRRHYGHRHCSYRNRRTRLLGIGGSFHSLRKPSRHPTRRCSLQIPWRPEPSRPRTHSRSRRRSSRSNNSSKSNSKSILRCSRISYAHRPALRHGAAA